MSKNEKMLASFAEYCQKHPEQRFWQALRNWAQDNIDADINFIYVAPIEHGYAMMDGDTEEAAKLLRETFNWEDDRLG